MATLIELLGAYKTDAVTGDNWPVVICDTLGVNLIRAFSIVDSATTYLVKIFEQRFFIRGNYILRREKRHGEPIIQRQPSALRYALKKRDIATVMRILSIESKQTIFGNRKPVIIMFRLQ
jgi:hypothetical protein